MHLEVITTVVKLGKDRSKLCTFLICLLIKSLHVVLKSLKIESACSLKCSVHLRIAPWSSWPQKNPVVPCQNGQGLGGWQAPGACLQQLEFACQLPPRRAKHSPRVPSHLPVSFCLFVFWKLFRTSRFVNGIVKIKLWEFYTLLFRSDTNTNSILEELWRSGLIQWISKSFWKWV